MEKWKPGTEGRCEFIIRNGDQCYNQAVPGCLRCEMHGADKILRAVERKSLDMYRFAKFQARVDELKEHNDVKSLRSEIGVLRMILEEKMNKCTDSHDLTLMAGPISDLVMKIEKLVTSCQRLENSLGGLLDKQQVKNTATQLMQIISDCINVFCEKLLDGDLTKERVTELASELLEDIANKFLEVINASVH